jgi:hypothetical protein
MNYGTACKLAKNRQARQENWLVLQEPAILLLLAPLAVLGELGALTAHNRGTAIFHSPYLKYSNFRIKFRHSAAIVSFLARQRHGYKTIPLKLCI